MIEKIWYLDPMNFINGHNFDKFFPTPSMNFAEQLNSLVRLSIYFSIIVFIVKKNANIFLIPLFVGGFTYFIYMVDVQNKTKDKFELQSKNRSINRKDGSLCIAPSKENPFMNVLMSDYKEDPERPKACDITDKNISVKTKDYFDSDLYRDVDDIFHKKASDRQFYTTPSTTIPNDAVAFAKWCYGSDKTCKEGNGVRCLDNTYRYIKE